MLLLFYLLIVFFRTRIVEIKAYILILRDITLFAVGNYKKSFYILQALKLMLCPFLTCKHLMMWLSRGSVSSTRAVSSFQCHNPWYFSGPSLWDEARQRLGLLFIALALNLWVYSGLFHTACSDTLFDSMEFDASSTPMTPYSVPPCDLNPRRLLHF